ncbi:MAG: hypothetical protein AAB791_03285, partial [Patescibacteria group bacterium]
MRQIFYLANARIPTEKAHGIQIVKMCEALAAKGVKVSLVLPWRFNGIKQDIFKYYKAEKIFSVGRIFSLDLIPLHLPWFGFMAQSLSFAVACLYLTLKKTDIIYSRDLWPLVFLSFFGKRLVYEVHSLPKHRFWPNFLFRKSLAIVVITEKI